MFVIISSMLVIVEHFSLNRLHLETRPMYSYLQPS